MPKARVHNILNSPRITMWPLDDHVTETLHSVPTCHIMSSGERPCWPAIMNTPVHGFNSDGMCTSSRFWNSYCTVNACLFRPEIYANWMQGTVIEKIHTRMPQRRAATRYNQISPPPTSTMKQLKTLSSWVSEMGLTWTCWRWGHRDYIGQPGGLQNATKTVAE